MPEIADALSLNELYVPALCVWREMRGRGSAERLGCYWVIRNRANDKQGRGWPKSLAGVVTQRYQFSSFNVTDPNVKFPIPDGSPDWQAWTEIIAMITGDLPPDPTGGANSYESMPDARPRPRWADPAKMTVQLGQTRFYKL